MTNIVRTIGESITKATGLQFHYNASGEINNIADGVTFPCAYAFLLDSSAPVEENGQLRERLTLAIVFADLTEYDFDAVENEDIITECKERAFEWYLKARRSGDFNAVTLNSTQRLYDELDAIVTGYALNVTIEEARAFGDCDFMRM